MDNPIYAVRITTAAEDVSALDELMATLDLPPQAVSSYEDLETATGITYILCDTAAEAAAAQAHVTPILRQWEHLLAEPIRAIDQTTIKREDWSESWKKYFHPFRASNRLVIKPSWEDYEAQPTDIVLEIDPGMCFGTGSHGTTMGCLQYLDELAEAPDRPCSLIDAGCGTAILSMAAKRLGYGPIFAFDYDPAAIHVSQENLERAGILDQVALAEGDVHTIQPPFQADLVVANILAPILLTAAENLANMVRPGGRLVLSGILTSQYDEVLERFVQLGFKDCERRTIKEWTSGVVRKS
ncbi:MAG: 50S ribosomal protein L11 methyltransferase [Victivallales bacterium]|nr:50S ribosomal protein L11 methyltransferase [Victivallales bacterium]